MPVNAAEANVRQITERVAVVDFTGQLTAAAEEPLMQAYARASSGNAKAIVLNLSGLQYMNSSGVGLLVRLLTRVNRKRQRLLAYGAKERYLQIFALTRLNEVIGLYGTEKAALAAAGGA